MTNGRGWVWLLSICLAACSSGSSGSTTGPSCTDACNRLTTCSAAGNFCATCPATIARWRPEFGSAFLACVTDPATPCDNKMDDNCLTVAGRSLTIRPSDTSYFDACMQKRRDCTPTPFPDDYCSSILFADPLPSQMSACLAKPCAEVKACLEAIVK